MVMMTGMMFGFGSTKKELQDVMGSAGEKEAERITLRRAKLNR